MSGQQRGRRQLDCAMDRAEGQTPAFIARFLHWVRQPQSRWVRLPLGLFFIACAFFWFMPIVGIEFLPLGLLLLAQDIPLLRKPVARFLLWLEDKWAAHQRRKSARQS